MSWIVRGRAYIVVVRMIFEFPALSTDEKYVHRYCQEIVRLSSIRSACAYVYVCARVCVWTNMLVTNSQMQPTVTDVCRL